MRFGVLQFPTLQLTQERDRGDRARDVLVAARNGLRVDDGVPAARVLDWVSDFHLQIAPIVVINRLAALHCELEADGRLVYPDTGRMLVAVLLPGLRGLLRQQRDAHVRILFRFGAFFIFFILRIRT